MNALSPLCGALAALSVIASAGRAEVYQWTSGFESVLAPLYGLPSVPTGHWYERIDAAVTWDEACAQAETRGGYLATIHSAGENRFLSDVLGASGSVAYHWLGGHQPPESSEPSGSWQWVEGDGPISTETILWGWDPTVPYNNWFRTPITSDAFGMPVDVSGDGVPDFQYHEPNDSTFGSLVGENALLFDHAICPFNGWMWNDLNKAQTAAGYIIEWNAAPAAVPEGGNTLLLTAAACMALALGRRTLRR